jgi:hypothetical protein
VASVERLRCPSCGLPLEGPEETCPRCGADTRVVVLTEDVEPARIPPSTPRERLAGRLRPLSTLLVVVLLGSLLWLARDRTPTGQRVVAPTPVPSSSILPGPLTSALPLALTGGRWSCPAGWLYAAYASTGPWFYPPNHPRVPSATVRPAACYATPTDAQSAGYAEGPDPTGAVQVDGVYLVPTGDILGARCQPSADGLGFAVPCPTELPNLHSGRPPIVCADDPIDGLAACRWHGFAFLFVEGGFAVPPEFHVLNPENVPHLFVAAWTGWPSSAISAQALESQLMCSGAARVGSVDLVLRYQGATAVADQLACRDGEAPIRDHTVLRWELDGITYEVGVEGFTSTSEALARAVASALTLVRPFGADS